MSTLKDIEALAEEYAASYRELEGAWQALEDGIRHLKRKMVPVIRQAVERAALRKAVLAAAVAEAPEHFERPRTQVLAGVKLGFQKRRGQVAIDDEAATIRRMRELLPRDQAELLIRVKESVYRNAVLDLSAADLKRLGIRIEADTDEVVVKIAGEDIERMVDALLKADDEIAGKEAA